MLLHYSGHLKIHSEIFLRYREYYTRQDSLQSQSTLHISPRGARCTMCGLCLTKINILIILTLFIIMFPTTNKIHTIQLIEYTNTFSGALAWNPKPLDYNGWFFRTPATQSQAVKRCSQSPICLFMEVRFLSSALPVKVPRFSPSMASASPLLVAMSSPYYFIRLVNSPSSARFGSMRKQFPYINACLYSPVFQLWEEFSAKLLLGEDLPVSRIKVSTNLGFPPQH